MAPETIGELAAKIEDNTVSSSAANIVFDDLWHAGDSGNVDSVIEQRGLKQITDISAIETMVDDVIAGNPGQVEQFRSGKEKVIGFLVGQVMKASEGKANPQQVNETLRQKLRD